MKTTEILAIYASFLSTVVFFWNVRRATSRVKIELIFGIAEIGEEPSVGVYVSVKNPSAQTVHLSDISPLYPSKRPSFFEMAMHVLKYRRLPWSLGWVHTSFSYFDIDDGCPVSLEPGKGHKIFIPQEKVEKILEDAERKELKAVAQDELWRNKYSKAFSVD